MMRVLPVICCDACDARLAEYQQPSTLHPLAAGLAIELQRRGAILRHAGCSGATLWRWHKCTAEPGEQPERRVG